MKKIVSGLFLYRINVIFQSVGDQVINVLMEDDEVINYIFTLLAHNKTFINSCQLIEDMLQSKRQVLDLHRISK